MDNAANVLLSTIKVNEAIVVVAGGEQYVFWNSEDFGKVLIAGYYDDLQNYYKVDKISKNSLTVVDWAFAKKPRRRLEIWEVYGKKFSLTLWRLKKEHRNTTSDTISDKEVSHG